MGHIYTKVITHCLPKIYLGILYFYMLNLTTLCMTEIKDWGCHNLMLDMSLHTSTVLI